MRTSLSIGAIMLCLTATSALAAKDRVDLLFTNGHVITVDDDFSIRSAVAVKDGRIVAVGGDDIARDYSAPATIDLRGRTLMPGFTDSHVHIRPMAPRQISTEGLTSIADLQARIRAKAKELGPGEWITGFGWDEALFAEKRVPVRGDLDAAAPDNPVVLTRNGSHSSVGNSLALKLAGITRDTPDPENGVIERDAAGEPNGVIRERSDLYYSKIPADKYADIKPSYLRDMQYLASLGITTFFSATTRIDDEPVGKGGIANPGTELTFRRTKELHAEQKHALPRARLYISYPGPERIREFPYRSGDGDEWVRLSGFGEDGVDGGYTGPAAWLTVDYKTMPKYRGVQKYSDDELQAFLDDAARNGWQMALHAIGDAGITQAVRAMDKALNNIQAPPPMHQGKNRRWFLAHLTTLPSAEILALMKKNGIAAAVQPNFLYNLEDRYRAWLEGDTLNHINAVATPLKHDIRLAFSSDNLPIGPMFGIYAATTRKGPSGEAIGPEEAISRREAIRLYTREPAYLSWEEDVKGAIKPGMYADMIILDKDPLAVPDEDLLKINVDLTMVGGKVIYERSGNAANR